MDWTILFYAILITIAVIGGIILFVWLLTKYEKESYVAILILMCVIAFITVVYGVYLLLLLKQSLFS